MREPAQTPQVTTKPAKLTFYSQTNFISSMKSLKAKIHDNHRSTPGFGARAAAILDFDNNAGVSDLYNGYVVPTTVGD
jgi:hypothetical protein